MSLRNAIFLVLFFAGSGFCDDGVLLTCETNDGKQEIHIYVNEAEGYVVYDIQDNEDWENLRDFLATEMDIEIGVPGSLLEMNISSNNESTIAAEKENAVFLLTKSSLTFAYASLVVLEGPTDLIAWGGHTMGKCSKEPLAGAK